ncbi:MAG: hypothetical protein GQ582_13085 [Methyloprofundus sp.]|nr:hypothetical protein [Methyloprofundus sp.]
MKSTLSLSAALILTANLVSAEEMMRYEVSLTNITKGQAFTPQLIATHDDSVRLFTFGQPASEPLEMLAEAGDTTLLTELIMTVPDKVGYVMTVPGLLEPGKTVTVEIKGHPKHHQLTFAAMLLPTNDTFVALQGMSLPTQGSVSYFALAYDAGTEANDQNCAHIPGPYCGGEAHSMASDRDEGFVYISNGFHDLGEMDAEGNEILGTKLYDWRDSVAYVTIKRINKN